MTDAAPAPLVAPYGHLDQTAVVCAAKAAQYYAVPELLLHAIIQKEGGRMGQRSRNSNGSYDLGLAQINTVWLDHFKRYGVRYEHLLNDTCTNIYAAAYVLRTNVNRYGGQDWFRATIAYNIGPSKWQGSRYRIGYKYAHDVVSRWWSLHRRLFPGTSPERPAEPTGA